MKLKYETMQLPGHSGLGSTVVVVCGTMCGLGLGFGGLVAALVLSQHTEPFLQFDVCGMSTDGRSQKAAIMFSKQNPGHRGPKS